MLPVFYSLEQFYKRKHVLFILRLQHDYVVWDIDGIGILFNDRWVKGGYLIYTTRAAQSEPYVSLMIQMREVVSIGQCNKKYNKGN